MELRDIEEADVESAVTLLGRGFPDRRPGYWGERVAALQTYRSRCGVGPIGSLLSIRGEDVGVLLTIENAFPGDLPRVNLSSWFVEERARLGAARMLQKAVAGNAVYTDLTPTPAVRVLNQRLGLLPVRLGSMLVPVFPGVLGGCSRGRVRSFTTEHAAGLTPAERTLLADHAAMGLLSAVLCTDDGAEPLVLMRTSFRGVRGARVLYARSRERLQVHRGALARYLASQRLWFLEIEANRAETWPGALYAPSRSAVFVKGPLHQDTIDHSYSELAFIHSY